MFSTSNTSRDDVYCESRIPRPARPECFAKQNVSKDESIKLNLMKYFYVYILKCSDGSYYVGHTDDLDKRISEHHVQMIDSYTKSRLPVEVVFTQHFASRDDAFRAERQIKGWARKKKEALIAGNWELVSRLAKKEF